MWKERNKCSSSEQGTRDPALEEGQPRDPGPATNWMKYMVRPPVGSTRAGKTHMGQVPAAKASEIYSLGNLFDKLAALKAT